MALRLGWTRLFFLCGLRLGQPLLELLKIKGAKILFRPWLLGELLKFWQEQYDYFENRTAAAVNVAVSDLKQMPPDVNLHKVAAWAMVSRAILNLDETITKE